MKTDGGKAFTGDIKFNDVTPNIGAAMNGPEGIFRAPVAGYYKFSFSASSGYKKYSGTYGVRLKYELNENTNTNEHSSITTMFSSITTMFVFQPLILRRVKWSSYFRFC